MLFPMNDAVSPALLAKRRASLGRIERVAWWLDDAFELPIIRKIALPLSQPRGAKGKAG